MPIACDCVILSNPFPSPHTAQHLHFCHQHTCSQTLCTLHFSHLTIPLELKFQVFQTH